MTDRALGAGRPGSGSIADLLVGRDWDGQPGAEEDTLRRLVETAPVPLPADDLDLLRVSDGGHFILTGERTYLRLWSAADAIAGNRDYQVAEQLPGWFAIGDAGGLEVYALEHVTAVDGQGAWPVSVVPYVPMEAAGAVPIAPDLRALLSGLAPTP